MYASREMIANTYAGIDALLRNMTTSAVDSYEKKDGVWTWGRREEISYCAYVSGNAGRQRVTTYGVVMNAARAPEKSRYYTTEDITSTFTGVDLLMRNVTTSTVVSTFFDGIRSSDAKTVVYDYREYQPDGVTVKGTGYDQFGNARFQKITNSAVANDGVTYATTNGREYRGCLCR